MSTNRKRYRITVDECDRMINASILTENHRIELIRGELVEKLTVGDRRIAVMNRLNRRLRSRLMDRAILSIQNPIRLRDSEPEPDTSLLGPNPDDHESGKPQAK